MAGKDDGIAPETLTDDLVIPPLSETLSVAEGDGVSRVKVSDVSVEGFDINTPLDEDDTTTMLATVVDQSETKVDTTMRLGPVGPDFSLVEPKSSVISTGADAHESLIIASKDVETGPDMGSVEPESKGVFDGADVHGSLTSTPKDVETRLDFGLVEPKSNGDSISADVHGSFTYIPNDVETGPELCLVEPKSNIDSVDTDVHGSHVSTRKDVETGQDIDLIEPDSKGIYVCSDVNELISLSSNTTTKDVETGPDFGLVEPENNGVFVVADVHESLIGTSKDVETGQGFGLDEPESNGVSVNADVHGLIEPENNGVSVVVDVHESPIGTPNDVEMDAKGVEMENGNGVNASASGTTVDSDAETDGVTEGDESVDYVEEHDYSVGDIVWGKVKSHPWWPGQIYDSSDASIEAMKYKPIGRLLVAYYGDGTFAWCLPSQLIPFAENFKSMPKQSGNKNYVNAVTKAVDEIGRHVDVAMTCGCVPEDNRKGLSGAPVVNAGIKPGVIAPEGDIDKLLSSGYDPSEILATVAITAQTVSFTNKLKLSILKGWLSSFYRAKGGFSLPCYHEPDFVQGLEDISETGDVGVADVSVPLQGPVEEECGSFTHLLENIVNRKQRSVAELIASGTDTTPKNRKSEGKASSNSANKKRKASEKDGSCSDIIQDCSTRKKRSRKDMDKMYAEYGISSEEKLQENSMPRKSLTVDIPCKNDESGDTKLFGETFSPRERKKSKYLSPPFTSPLSRVGYPSYKDEEFERITQIPKVGERMTKAAVQLLDSTSLKCNGETENKQVPVVYSREKKGVKSVEKSGKKDHNSNNIYVNAGGEELLSGLISIAAGPVISLSASMLKLTRTFISDFRSSMYLNGESYDIYHKRQPSKTTESVNLELQNLVHGSVHTGMESPAGQTKGKKRGRNSENKSDTPKPKRAARCSTKKGFLDGVEVPLASSLILTFDPAFPLPSKGEIIEKFSELGNIDENETVVFSESCNVKIVYMNKGCVEAALKASLCQNPFFSGIVDYKLCYTQTLE